MGLLNVFGDVPWLSRYLNLGLDPKVIGGIEKILLRLSGAKDVTDSIDRVKNDKQLELEFQHALLEAENEYWKVCLRDRQNARERDLALRKVQGRNRRANLMLVIAILGIVLSLSALVFFKSFLTSDVIGIISAVAAIFGSCLKDAYSFEFGDHIERKSITASMTDKEIMARMAEIERLIANNFEKKNELKIAEN